MPLIVVCGVPGSGKTRRSQQIADHLTNKHKCKVVIVNEENLGINKKIAYSCIQIITKQVMNKK